MKSLHVPDGTVEALKWIALALMTGDHVNKYLFVDFHPEVTH
ncbi:TraX family protein [Cupriavidus taiwanensis]|nr:TraX family protein [Cupriavidus taiwanensis]MDK3025103.1 TraX family protein [Cupriavidus taiwanensis]